MHFPLLSWGILKFLNEPWLYSQSFEDAEKLSIKVSQRNMFKVADVLSIKLISGFYLN